MKKTFLDENWRFIGKDPEKRDKNGSYPDIADTSGWLDIDFPGDVNDVLVKQGLMPTPHFGDNGRQCYWVTSKDWFFRKEFMTPENSDGKSNDLCFDGVDGTADVYLNEKLLGTIENAFRPRRFDVTDALRENSSNILLLHFHSIDQILEGPREDELAGWRGRRALMRKPQFSFGWDWSLPLPSIGIMGAVWLEEYEGPRILDLSVKPNLSGRLDFKFRVNTKAREKGYHLEINVRGHGANLKEIVQRPGRCFSHKSLTIDNPKLWWPNGMGEQVLYDYEVSLICDGEEIEKRSGKTAIRESRILEEPFTEEAGPGISFWIEINGQRVFCKGGNWIPLELWPATVKDEQYDFYLRKAIDANFNMLRIWGGGIYERDIFYDLCDELGIMIWQDFMFASTGYPIEKLRHEIIAEAEHQVKRLRNHPSIVLWCGCNEDCYSWNLSEQHLDRMADTGTYAEPGESMKINRLRDDPQIYSMILRGTVGLMGLGVPYIESSPESYEDAGNMHESGNCHVSCWKYALFLTDGNPARYRGHFEQVCSFDSEFCIQGPCDLWSFRQFMPEEHLWPPDDIWTYYIQRGHGNLPHHEQTLQIAGDIFGPINSLEQYVKFGQATHSEQMRAEFESARRDRPNNGGTMMWMFNDCRPTSNWSIIDFFKRPKPSYYAAKRACATLLPIIMERNAMIQFFFSNDGPEPVVAEVRCGIEDLAGGQSQLFKGDINCHAVSTSCFFQVSRHESDLRRNQFLFIEACVNGRTLPKITYFPNLWKDVPWPVPQVKIDLLSRSQRRDKHVSEIKLTSDVYARFLHVIPPVEAGEFWLSDNFFDLCAGESRSITVVSEHPVDINTTAIGHWLTEWP